MSIAPHFAARGAPPGSMRWHALVYAPPPSRDRLAAAFALDAELREIASGSLDHEVAHAKLRWWHDEATRLGAGAPRHPLTIALHASTTEPGQLAADLTKALSAAEVELAQMVLQDAAEFDTYLRGAGEAIARLGLAARAGDPTAARFAAGCGRAIRLVEVIRDLRRDAWRGRVFPPWPWVEEAGAGLEGLRGDSHCVGTRVLLERLAALARGAWDEARAAAVGGAAADWRPLYVLADLHLALLARIERTGFAIECEPMELPPLMRPYFAWRAARRA